MKSGSLFCTVNTVDVTQYMLDSLGYVFHLMNTINAVAYGQRKAVRWRHHRRSCELVAADEERALCYFLYIERDLGY
jgi:hypothetical protein